MNYADIFQFPGWEPLAFTILQTAIVFCFILVGLHLIGRRVFAQRGTQDLIIIVLVGESSDLGLAHEDAGFWGSIASIATLFLLGYLTERIGFLRKMLNGDAIPLYSDGKLHRSTMRKHMVDEEDLNEVAREHGKESYKNFECMLLEGDGEITGVNPCD
jgi:uncharacterized membrane protein YcaP (DUF421 family)